MPDLSYDVLFKDGEPGLEGFESLEEARAAGAAQAEQRGPYTVQEIDRSSGSDSDSAPIREVYDAAFSEMG